MYRLINERAEDIAKAILRDAHAGAIETYNWLRAELQRRDVSTDLAYQRKFRAFWRIRCGEAWGRAYFAILQREKVSSSCDAVSVALELLSTPSREDKQTLQFSFATKLAHMVDPHLPIYDSMVSAFFFIGPPSGETHEKRLLWCRKICDFLGTEYARVLKNGLLAPAIEILRTSVPDTRDHTDEKIVDWLIWQFVDLSYREGWFIRQTCRHAGSTPAPE